MPTKTQKLPFFKNMTDDALRAEYAGYRALAYNNAAIGGHAAAQQMGTLMRAVQLIEGIARQRGISLRIQARNDCACKDGPNRDCLIHGDGN